MRCQRGTDANFLVPLTQTSPILRCHLVLLIITQFEFIACGPYTSDDLYRSVRCCSSNDFPFNLSSGIVERNRQSTNEMANQGSIEKNAHRNPSLNAAETISCNGLGNAKIPPPFASTELSEAVNWYACSMVICPELTWSVMYDRTREYMTAESWARPIVPPKDRKNRLVATTMATLSSG